MERSKAQDNGGDGAQWFSFASLMVTRDENLLIYNGGAC
jgi:hypothetical protein